MTPADLCALSDGRVVRFMFLDRSAVGGALLWACGFALAVPRRGPA
jgi:hypothetical protein